ncbi:hypothetical protein Tco_0757576, partial [Tanacetum coccineum]
GNGEVGNGMGRAGKCTREVVLAINHGGGRYGFGGKRVEIQRISLTGFPAQSVGSSNTDVLDSPCLLVLITGTSQSRQHSKSESDSYYLSDLVVNSFTGPKLISNYHKLDSYTRASHLPRACLMLAQAGFPSSL